MNTTSNNATKDNKDSQNTIDFVDYSESTVTGTISDQSYQMIKGIVVDLKQVVDQIDRDFKKAKDLVTEIARRLDEGRFCERGHISRRIKEMLQEKIKEGKITSKWIEDCLPHEYKRKYTSKSEVSSLSENNDDTKKDEILIDTYGQSSSVKASQDSWGRRDNTEDNESKFAASKPNHGILTTSDNQETSHQIDCPRCKELEDALLKASSVVSADKLQNDDKIYRISKEKHNLLIAAMRNSQQFCFAIFDKNGTLVHAEPDISREISND